MADRLYVYGPNGERIPVWDEEDVEVLIALAHIKALLSVAAAAPALVSPEITRSAAERHLLEHGHVLQFGCCRPRYEDDA
jgi:hypothetical protein